MEEKIDNNTVLCNIVFTKELFIETIDALEKQHKHDTKCSNAFCVILPNANISTYSNEHILNQLIKIIQIAMNDNHSDSWIDYFMWELDFGTKYYDGCVVENDKFIELKNASDLWNILTNKKE